MFPQLNFEKTPVTMLLMAVMAALEVMGMLDTDSRTRFYNEWMGLLPSIWDGEIWRPFTTTLLHGGLMHAFFNLYILALFGATLEHWVGPFRFLGLVVFLAFMSSLPQFMVSNYIMERDKPGIVGIIGFSGVNYGLFGLLWIGRRYRMEFNWVCNPGTVRMMVGWLFLCILLTNLGILPVANVAHAAGLIFGALIALSVFRPKQRWQWGSLLAVVAALVLSIQFYPQLFAPIAFGY